VEQTVYHVLLEGRTIGPYDRRTIVGMRIKRTLTSDHVLITPGGAQLTVAELIGRRPAQPLSPDRSGSVSLVQAIFSASLLEIEGPGMAIPKFKDEIQVRVQVYVLRVAGRFRQRLGWREGRVKILLQDVAHAQVKGSQVDLWLRHPQQARLQRIALDLFTPDAAGEFVDWLPSATPYPVSTPAAVPVPVVPPAVGLSPGAPTSSAMWVAVVGVTLVVALMLMVLLLRRVY
jgi:hypothetical protein